MYSNNTGTHLFHFDGPLLVLLVTCLSTRQRILLLFFYLPLVRITLAIGLLYFSLSIKYEHNTRNLTI